jgi:glycosyltransferase involved in cell wall biosynthesis
VTSNGNGHRELPSISAIVCTLNEEGNIAALLGRIPDFVNEVVLVDGHSTDATLAVARRARPEARVFLQPGRGKGDALRHGFAQAGGEIIVTLDADGATDPAAMWLFVSPLLQGWDFVKGSRFRAGRPPGMGPHRVLGNRLLALAGNLLYGVSFTDVCSGYNALWRDALDRLDWQDLGDHDYEITLYWRALRRGLRVLEVGHHDAGRTAGESKMASWHTGWNNFKIIVRERFRPEGRPAARVAEDVTR